MNAPENPSPPTGPVLIPNPGLPTVRASNVLINQDGGGAFIVTFYEDRQQRPAVAGATFSVENRAWNELVRLSLTPEALRYLRDQIDGAVVVHERIVGRPIVTPQQVADGLRGAVGDKVVDRAQELLRPPEPPEPK